MKTFILLQFFALISISINAQTKDRFEELPYDSLSNKIEFSRIIEFPNTSKNEIALALDLLKSKLVGGGEFTTKQALKNNNYYYPISYADYSNYTLEKSDSVISKAYQIWLQRKNLTNIKNVKTIMIAVIKDNKMKLIFSDFTADSYSTAGIRIENPSLPNNTIRKNKKGLEIVNAFWSLSFQFEEILKRLVVRTNANF